MTHITWDIEGFCYSWHLYDLSKSDLAFREHLYAYIEEDIKPVCHISGMTCIAQALRDEILISLLFLEYCSLHMDVLWSKGITMYHVICPPPPPQNLGSFHLKVCKYCITIRDISLTNPCLQSQPWSITKSLTLHCIPQSFP